GIPLALGPRYGTPSPSRTGRFFAENEVVTSIEFPARPTQVDAIPGLFSQPPQFLRIDALKCCFVDRLAEIAHRPGAVPLRQCCERAYVAFHSGIRNPLD